jgi:tRNA1Val (adenine37-N6)-methyltransferase
MGFRLRHFEVDDSKSTMRVGTDSLLLGAWANPGNSEKILDVGTGCGVLALMLAQKSLGMIDAIDIDEASACQARENFLNSPWKPRINAICGNINTFSKETLTRYDFIISNPPFFGNSLKSPEKRKNQARHDTSLSHEELIVAVNHLLEESGAFCTILPAGSEYLFSGICGANNLYLSRKLEVSPKPRVPAKRLILEFQRKRSGFPETGTLSVLNNDGKFSTDYLALTNGYHQF